MLWPSCLYFHPLGSQTWAIHLVYAGLGIQPRALCRWSKHSLIWTHPQSINTPQTGYLVHCKALEFLVPRNFRAFPNGMYPSYNARSSSSSLACRYVFGDWFMTKRIGRLSPTAPFHSTWTDGAISQESARRKLKVIKFNVMSSHSSLGFILTSF